MIVTGLNIDPEVLSPSDVQPVHHSLAVGETTVTLDVVTASAGKRFESQQASDPWQPLEVDRGEIQIKWNERVKRMGAGYSRSLFFTPTNLGTRESHGSVKIEQKTSDSRRPVNVSVDRQSRDRQALMGTLAHRVLQTWNFQEDPEKLPALIGEICGRSVPNGWQGHMQDFVHELREIFHGFVLTAPYVILRQAEIIGREVPITVPWYRRDSPESSGVQVASAVLYGVMDVVYRWKDHIWVADYKTNIINPDSPDSMNLLVANYRAQAIAYREALTNVFKGTPVRAHVIFLRNGTSIEV